MKVRFTKPALAELDAIFAYIHQHNPVAAGQVVDRVREITSQLGRFPDMGHPKYTRRSDDHGSALSLFDFLHR